MKIEAIIEGCKTHNEKAQKALYDIYCAKLWAVALRYARSHQDAQDIFQEGWIKAFANFNKYSNKGSLEGWLRRLFVNYALNYYRGSKNSFAISENSLPSQDLSEEEEDQCEYMLNFPTERIMECISLLPNMQRMVFNLVEIEGNTYSQVAKKLSLSEQCIRSHNCKAKQRLRQLLLSPQDNEKTTQEK